LHSKALAIRRRLLGNENAETAASLNDLGAVYRDQGRHANAEAMTLEALRTREKLFGSENLAVAASLRNLCMVLGYQGKWAEAEEAGRKVLDLRRKLLPSGHPEIASALHDVAWAANGGEKFAEAEMLEAEALSIRLNILDDSHPDVPRTLNSLGQLLGKRGDLPASEAVLKAVLVIQRKLVGEDDKSTLETFCSLAKVLDSAGKLPEAETMWREALVVWDRRGGKENPERLYTLRGLGETLEKEGKWSEAETVWRDSLVAWRNRGGVEERQSMFTLRKLGLVLEAERRWPEAESVHREALAVSSKKGDEDPEALVDLDRVVRALTFQKKFTEAQQLLDRILTPAFVAKPVSVNLLVLRVNVMGRQGRWQQAAADAALALEHQPTDHYRYHTLAMLLAITNDRPAYEQLCKRLVANFSGPTDPYVAERVVQDCLVLPNSGADLELMDKLADTAVTLGSSGSSLPYFQACKAISNYRLGQFSKAITWGEKAANSAKSPAQAKAYAVLAMAHWQLGWKDEARAALARGDALAPGIVPGSGVEDLGESWVAWLMARISLDEAARLLKNESTVENSNPP
jgi:tetratricopeptide (TPR) repeat protein